MYQIPAIGKNLKVATGEVGGAFLPHRQRASVRLDSPLRKRRIIALNNKKIFKKGGGERRGQKSNVGRPDYELLHITVQYMKSRRFRCSSLSSYDEG